VVGRSLPSRRRVSGRVGKRGGGSAGFGRLRKSSPTSRVGASTWVGIGSRGAGWLVRRGSNRRETLTVERGERGGVG